MKQYYTSIRNLIRKAWNWMKKMRSKKLVWSKRGIIVLSCRLTSESDLIDSFVFVESWIGQFQSRIVLAVSFIGCYNILPSSYCDRSDGIRLIDSIYRVWINIDSYKIKSLYIIDILSYYSPNIHLNITPVLVNSCITYYRKSWNFCLDKTSLRESIFLVYKFFKWKFRSIAKIN